MTVGELRKKLERFDDNYLVVAQNDNEDFCHQINDVLNFDFDNEKIALLDLSYSPPEELNDL